MYIKISSTFDGNKTLLVECANLEVVGYTAVSSHMYIMTMIKTLLVSDPHGNGFTTEKTQSKLKHLLIKNSFFKFSW